MRMQRLLEEIKWIYSSHTVKIGDSILEVSSANPIGKQFTPA